MVVILPVCNIIVDGISSLKGTPNEWSARYIPPSIEESMAQYPEDWRNCEYTLKYAVKPSSGCVILCFDGSTSKEEIVKNNVCYPLHSSRRRNCVI